MNDVHEFVIYSRSAQDGREGRGILTTGQKKRNQAIVDSECRLHNKKVQTPRPHTHKKGKRMNNRIKNKIQEMQEWTAGAPTESASL